MVGIGALGMATGGFVIGAGASDMKQGWKEFFLGMSGDSTTQTRNMMSDWFYDGNDTIYHLSTGVAAFAGSLLTPYVNAQLAGKTGVTSAGSTAGKATGVKPTVAKTAGGTADDALEQFYDDIFESSYREQFDPIKEQAIAGPGEIAGTTEGVKSGSEILEQLKQYIKNGVVKENNIISQMDENTQIIFRNDTGEFAHPINSHGYSNAVNHYNIEIQIRTAARKWKSKWSYWSCVKI